MKNKKALALLVALALVQLAFPLGFFAYENAMNKMILEKGQSYTLDYSRIKYFSKTYIDPDTMDIYTVGYDWDYRKSISKQEDKYYIPYNTVGIYQSVGIREKEDKTVQFFDIDNGTEGLTKYNWFETNGAFVLRFDEYEFVRDDFGMKELFATSFLVSDNTVAMDYEDFAQSEDGYYSGIYDISFEGKITLCVYNGRAKISEFYIGDELVLKHK